MGMLDFIKNRGAQQEPSAPQAKPETAKEMYTREAGQEKAAAKPLSQISPDQQAKVEEIRTKMQPQMQAVGQDASSSAPAPADATDNQQPMVQKSMSQDKAAPDLSPTSAQAGTRATQKDAPSETPQDKSQEQAKTVARRPPSWER